MTTDLVIIDAQRLQAGPLAVLHLPFHIPIGEAQISCWEAAVQGSPHAWSICMLARGTAEFRKVSRVSQLQLHGSAQAHKGSWLKCGVPGIGRLAWELHPGIPGTCERRRVPAPEAA